MGVVEGGQDVIAKAAHTMVGCEGVKVYQVDIGPGRLLVVRIVCVIQLRYFGGGRMESDGWMHKLAGVKPGREQSKSVRRDLCKMNLEFIFT